MGNIDGASDVDIIGEGDIADFYIVIRPVNFKLIQLSLHVQEHRFLPLVEELGGSQVSRNIFGEWVEGTQDFLARIRHDCDRFGEEQRSDD
jgi:hypothetical protein